jgi:putative ABC transport system permease protein
MNLLVTLRIAFKALFRNKMRSSLTMLGMIIGVSAVIAMVALANGARSTIESQIKSAGTNLITVMAGNFMAGGVHMGSGAANTLTVEDANAIRDEVAGIQYLAIGVSSRSQIIAGTNWNTRQRNRRRPPLIRSWPVGLAPSPPRRQQRGPESRHRLGGSRHAFGEGVDHWLMIRVRTNRSRSSASAQGPGHGRRDSTTSTCPNDGAEEAARHHPTTTSPCRPHDRVAGSTTSRHCSRHKIIRATPTSWCARSRRWRRCAEPPAMGALHKHRRSLLIVGASASDIMLVSVTERTARSACACRPAPAADVPLRPVEAVVLSLVGGSIDRAGRRVSMSLQVLTRPRSARRGGTAFGCSALTGVFFVLPAHNTLDPIEALRTNDGRPRRIAA